MAERQDNNLGLILEDLTDDEDFRELVELVVFSRAPRVFRERENHFTKWNDEEFRKRFRLSKQTVSMITDEIREEIVCLRNEHIALTPEEQVLATLRFLATGFIYQGTGDFIGIDKSTTCRIIPKVLRSLARRSEQFIQMPAGEEINTVEEGFFRIANFPKCIGALDCTHIKIQSPGGENPEYFRNRKGFFSFNVQAVCDSTLRIRDIVCRWPGSCHDSTIFNNSRLKRRLEGREFGNCVLVGDGGYPNTNFLITPLRNPQTPAENLFNNAQIRTRNPIERCFGVLKRRFPVLALGIRLNVDKVEAIVVACAVLHNIACQVGEALPEIDDRVQEAMNLIEEDLDEVPEGNNLRMNNVVRQSLINTYFQGRL